MDKLKRVDMFRVREALEASWDSATSNQHILEDGNPALGQCYPTSRVIQHFFPETEIVEGEVWTGKSTEKHFWNLLKKEGKEYHIDFTWQQFPGGSVIKNFKIRDRNNLGDGPETLKRVDILLKRVEAYLNI